MSEERLPDPTEIHAKRDPETGAYDVEAKFEPDDRTAIFAQLAYELLKDHDAPNFFTFECTSTEGIRMSITLQRMAWDAETPSSKLVKLTKENAQLKARLVQAEAGLTPERIEAAKESV